MTVFLSDYDYVLPEELIAAYPAKKRSESRLLCMDRKTGRQDHRIFWQLPDLLKSGDVLVLNDTKVIPARLLGKRSTGGEVEALLLKDLGNRRWEALLRPGGKIGKGAELCFGQNGASLSLHVMDAPRPGTGMRRVEFRDARYEELLEKTGHVPLPPYIQRPDEAGDQSRYQTVFAKNKGAVAAPTAGLHFDEKLLDQLRERGVEIVTVTLHVSYGTFQPIPVEDVSQYKIFEEDYEISEETANRINQAKKESRRIIACGTTSVRALESSVGQAGEVLTQKAKTRLFIYPPHSFRIADGLITNFHLPKSSLLLLVAAFLGREKTLQAYQSAIENRYRFYSYGDAMLIL